jgi:hypothetical protein
LNRYLKECALDPECRGFPSHDREVVLDIDLDAVYSDAVYSDAVYSDAGEAGAEVLGADLSFQYVKENADYRS